MHREGTWFGSPQFDYGYAPGDIVEGVYISECNHDRQLWWNLTTTEVCEDMTHAKYLFNKGAKISQVCDECQAYVHPTMPEDRGKDDYDFMFGGVTYPVPDVRMTMAGWISLSVEELQDKTMYAWFLGEID